MTHTTMVMQMYTSVHARTHLCTVHHERKYKIFKKDAELLVRAVVAELVQQAAQIRALHRVSIERNQQVGSEMQVIVGPQLVCSLY